MPAELGLLARAGPGELDFHGFWLSSGVRGLLACFTVCRYAQQYLHLHSILSELLVMDDFTQQQRTSC